MQVDARMCKSDPWSIMSATTQVANPIPNSVLLALWVRNSVMIPTDVYIYTVPKPSIMDTIKVDTL